MNIHSLIRISRYIDEVDFSGFWICQNKQHSASNDINYVRITIFPGQPSEAYCSIIMTTFLSKQLFPNVLNNNIIIQILLCSMEYMNGMCSSWIRETIVKET